MARNKITHTWLALAGMAMLASQDYGNAYVTHRHSSIDDQGEAAKPKLKPKRTLPANPKAAGLQEFRYDDNFYCWAINQKTADKKHAKWLAKQKKLE